MMYSLHSERLYSGSEDIVGFALALDAEADRELGLMAPRGCANNVESVLYKRIASYRQHVRRYKDVCGEDGVYVIIFDDFKDHPDKVFSDTLAFLGVDPRFRPRFGVLNSNKEVRHLKGRSLPHVRVVASESVREATAAITEFANSASHLNALGGQLVTTLADFFSWKRIAGLHLERYQTLGRGTCSSD